MPMTKRYERDDSVTGHPARLGDRASGLWGWVFVVLLLVSAGMASVPGGHDPTPTVRRFYTLHAGVISVAQVLGVVAAAAFVAFVRAVCRSAAPDGRGALRSTGFTVGGAAVLTAVPVVCLTVVAGGGSDSTVHALAVASDLTDVLLFGAIAGWLVVVTRMAERSWFTALAGAVAALALARAVLILIGAGALELVAPLAFVLVVAVWSTLLLARRSPLSSP